MGEYERAYDWAKRLVTAIRSSPDIGTTDQWLAANAELLAQCKKDNPKVHANIEAAVKAFKVSLMEQGEGS